MMNRRRFLKYGLGAGTAFAFSGLTLLRPRTAGAAATSVDLIAEGYYKSLVDGRSVFSWQFRDLNGSGPGALGSGLVVNEGETVTVALANTLDRPINFVIPGVLESTPPVLPGQTRQYTFVAPAAGSYLYTDEVNGEIGRAMGLAGPLVVMPADGSQRLFEGGPAFDRQYTLTLHEMDDRLNAAIATGGNYDMANYEPNYFFVNGLGYPDTAHDDDTLLAMAVGENVAIRFINTGCITNPQHFHGYHVRVTSRNRVPVTDVIDKDTVLVDIGECVDVVLPVAQKGVFPLHTHYVPGVCANGVYVNPVGGALLVMKAS